MRALISSLTMVSVLLHVLLGCHAHHAHAADAAGHEASEHESAHCSESQEPPSDSDSQPCDENQCDFGVSKFSSLEFEDVAAIFWMVVPAATDDSCPHKVGQVFSSGDDLLPLCSRPVLYCVLRN